MTVLNSAREKVLACDLCGSGEQIPFQTFGDRPVVTCGRCGLLYVRERLPDAELAAIYSQEYYVDRGIFIEDPEELKAHHRERLDWISWMGTGTGRTLLDVGCGTGSFLADARELGWTVLGTEVSPWCVGMAKERYDIEVSLGQLEDVAAAQAWPAGGFDVITCWHNLEHLRQPMRTLREMRRLLKPGGYLVIRTPNASSFDRRWHGESWQGWQDPGHFYFFGLPQLKRYGEAAGFEVCHVDRSLSRVVDRVRGILRPSRVPAPSRAALQDGPRRLKPQPGSPAGNPGLKRTAVRMASRLFSGRDATLLFRKPVAHGVRVPAAAPTHVQGSIRRPRLSVITLNWNRREDLREVIRSIEAQTYAQKEIIVVDNGSTDGSVEMLRTEFRRQVRVVALAENTGIIGYNTGVWAARGEFVVFVDNDMTFQEPDVLEKIVARLEANPKVGAVACRVLDARTGEISFNNPKYVEQGGSPQDGYAASVFDGGGVGFRRSAWLETGGYPEEFFIYQNEVDLSTHLWNRGWEVRYFPDMTVSHKFSRAARPADLYFRLWPRNYLWYFWKYYPVRWGLGETLRLLWRGYTKARREERRRQWMMGVLEAFLGMPGILLKRQPIRPAVLHRMEVIRIVDYCRKHGLDTARALSQGTMSRIFWPRHLRRRPLDLLAADL